MTAAAPHRLGFHPMFAQLYPVPALTLMPTRPNQGPRPGSAKIVFDPGRSCLIHTTNRTHGLPCRAPHLEAAAAAQQPEAGQRSSPRCQTWSHRWRPPSSTGCRSPPRSFRWQRWSACDHIRYECPHPPYFVRDQSSSSSFSTKHKPTDIQLQQNVLQHTGEAALWL